MALRSDSSLVVATLAGVLLAACGSGGNKASGGSGGSPGNEAGAGTGGVAGSANGGTGGTAGSATGGSDGGVSGPRVTAASCNATDVQAAIDQAADGYTVVIPAGTCTWKSAVTISKQTLTLRGASETGTVIQDDVDGTFLSVQLLSANSSVRVSNMTLEPAQGVTTTSGNAPLVLEGTCSASACSTIRMDHLTFTGWAYYSWGNSADNFPNFMIRADDVFGVVDHLNVDVTAGGEFLNVGYASYLGVGKYGDNSWAQPDAFGSNKALYIEDSTFKTTSSSHGWALTDTDNAPAGGGRFVVRHNTLVNFTVQTHGTESTGRTRGGRAYEIYDNSFTCSLSNGCQLINFRSGTGLVYDNTIATPGGFITGFVSLGDYRTFANLGGWGWCDGTGSWDDNDGVVYASGTISSSTPTSGTTSTVTDSSKSWSANQWVDNGDPYSLVDTTQGFGYEISASTADTLTVINAAQDYWNGNPTWQNGDSYQILRASACIDQPGLGKGDLISGDTPPTGWVHDTRDPIYEWGDKNSGTNYAGWVGPDTARIIANRDFYEQASSFNGTAGVGQGTLAQRPAKCTAGPGGNTPGVGYWAIDKNTLYVCNPTNTWTAYYTPFMYPYPLTVSGLPKTN